jgi:hypothetical protein
MWEAQEGGTQPEASPRQKSTKPNINKKTKKSWELGSHVRGLAYQA